MLYFFNRLMPGMVEVTFRGHSRSSSTSSFDRSHCFLVSISDPIFYHYYCNSRV